MSSRGARVQRRAEQRAREREVLRSVLGGPSGGRATCLAAGCDATGPVIRVGPAKVTLCPRHKRDFDRAWAAGDGLQIPPAPRVATAASAGQRSSAA